MAGQNGVLEIYGYKLARKGLFVQQLILFSSLSCSAAYPVQQLILFSSLSCSYRGFCTRSQSDPNSNCVVTATALPSPSQVLHCRRIQTNSRTSTAWKRLAWQNLIIWHNMMPGEDVFSLQSEKVNPDIKFWKM